MGAHQGHVQVGDWVLWIIFGLILGAGRARGGGGGVVRGRRNRAGCACVDNRKVHAKSCTGGAISLFLSLYILI